MSWKDYEPEEEPKIEEVFSVEIDLNDIDKSVNSIINLSINMVGKGGDPELGHLVSKATKVLSRPLVEYIADTRHARDGMALMGMCKAFTLILAVALLGYARRGSELAAAKHAAEGMKVDLLDILQLTLEQGTKH